MTLFIDASAMVAMIAREPEATTFGEIVSHHSERLCSPVAIWETVRAVARLRDIDVAEARALVADFIASAAISTVGIGLEESELALDAHQRFGRGQDVASLNMGDCFAYACAKRYNAEFLFKGNDFIHTDLVDATLS